MVNFITYISGDVKWLQLQSVMPKVALPTPEIEVLRDILGTHSLNNCISLYRLCCTFPFIQTNLPKETIELDFAGWQQARASSDASLVNMGRDLAVSLPINFKSVSNEPITITYKTDSTATISVGDIKLIVPVSYNLGILQVQWPEGWHIKGGLRLGPNSAWAPGTVLDVPVRYAYPVKEVDKALREREQLYDQLQHTNLVAEFYSADSAEERVAIAVLMLIRLVSK